MKRISLDNIEAKYKLNSYADLYEKVMSLIHNGKIKPVKASGINGKKPALYREYWIIEEKEDNSSYIEELSYLYVPAISTEYYLGHITQYKEDRHWVMLLNEYLKNRYEDLKIPYSINERSFAIWQREKFIKEEQGRKILKRCKISMDMLNVYETTEPLAYYVHTKETPQNILIVENKDTFYSMRKSLMTSDNEILGVSIGTLIYGAGKAILRSFQDFNLCVETYMTDKRNAIYYFGDMDYEGILIYEKMADLFADNYNIKLFCEGYMQMLERAEQIGEDKLPAMKEGQNTNISMRFFDSFESKQSEKMQYILQEGKYIPQEILSLEDF